MRIWPVTAAAATATFALVWLPPMVHSPAAVVTAASDLGQLLAAMLAGAGCWVAARRTEDAHRRSAWRWLAAGTWAWAAGEVAWSYYEVVRGRDVPFPSLSDVGYLLFPLLAGWGLVRWLGAAEGEGLARSRDLMDGLVIAGSLLALSWTTTLGSLAAAGSSDGWFPFALSLAYPVGDVVLGTLVLLAMARGRREDRTPLLLLTLGLLGVSLADSAFMYLTTTSAYSSADRLPSAGWTFGFMMVGVAGWAAASASARAERSRRTTAPTGVSTSRWQVALPYVPLALAGVAVASSLAGVRGIPLIPLLLGGLLVATVLLRQFLSALDNQRLLAALGDAHVELAHQAVHDSLTGLPNRVLFSDRLDRALLHAEADVYVMFCDLDDFKHVNDRLGHAAGDQLLREIAGRLRDCVRDVDTVARLGGDEFAVLLDHSDDADAVADRIVASLGSGAVLDGQRVATSVSVGVAHHKASLELALAPVPRDRRRSLVTPSAHERAELAEQLLRRADSAMYVAKSKGKNQVAVQQEPVETPAEKPVEESVATSAATSELSVDVPEPSSVSVS